MRIVQIITSKVDSSIEEVNRVVLYNLKKIIFSGSSSRNLFNSMNKKEISRSQGLIQSKNFNIGFMRRPLYKRRWHQQMTLKVIKNADVGWL